MPDHKGWSPIESSIIVDHIFLGSNLDVTIEKKSRHSTAMLNLETAVGSQKSAQPLGAPGKIQKCLITTKVTTTFCISPCTPIACTAFLCPTAVSRLKIYRLRHVKKCPEDGMGFSPSYFFQALSQSLRRLKATCLNLPPSPSLFRLRSPRIDP